MAQSVHIIIGSNLGERTANLQMAKLKLETYLGPVIQQSSIYESEPWGTEEEQLNYLNQVFEIDTYRGPGQILDVCLAIEKMMGRERSGKYASRTIDIDILLLGKFVCNTAHLRIPHPHMSERRFVLMPLEEIAPDIEHPVLKKSIHKLLEEVEDPLKVWPLNEAG